MRDGAIRYAYSFLRGAALAASLTAATTVAATASPPVMVVGGQFGVSPTGAATYSMPVAVPPGTAGIVPSLSLDYSSQAEDGFVGWQWSLGGVPSITRCSRSVKLDGVKGGVNFDSNDRFCLNGQRLIVINGGTYGANLSEYRTEVDGFLKIIAHTATGVTGIAYFEVQDKAGQTLQFGETTDSRAFAVGTTAVRVWAVNQVKDIKTNFYNVTYTNDAVNGQIYPIRIDYTGNAAASKPVYDSVQLTYDTTSRVDVVPTYEAGSLIKVTALLTHVKTFVGTSLVSDYQLGYRTGTTSVRTRLTSVTRCDSSGTTCLAPTTFGWQGRQ
jgi:hypothetical protein